MAEHTVARNRFWKCVDVGDYGKCWEWKNHRNKKGYGRVRISGKRILAHRIALILSGTEVPDHLCVLHSCDNPACCNPSHLRVGTPHDNVRDAIERGRHVNPKPSRGENAYNCKLTDAQVEAIRASGKMSSVLARELGVSQRHIGRIRSGLRRVAISAAIRAVNEKRDGP